MAEKVVAEKYHQLEPATGHSGGDHEASATTQSEELKRQKRIKMYKYIGIFIVFQIVVMSVFGMTVMKVKSPKIRLGNIYVLSLNSVPAAPSFDMSFVTQIRVRNLNWGTFKFDAGMATFMYQGVPVGQVAIPNSKVRMRSTKKIDVVVSVNSAALPSNSALGSELSNGLLMLSSQAKLSGKVTLMMIMKKNKSAEMSCSMVFNLAAKSVQNLDCN
ncbi:unnamed protein product [Malus baccata var. baccata]|uniref:Late embryogenesis abundant protein LEA-2 subgroup domain-containing protein n=2 Tax=Maleae TaxID=721813 RepID=A0A5N5G033_9ROSA|nr:uncharacterized protein LOC125469348 [Pyrus x bretschneideri]KAB2608713.1 hypothetical protein D8674_011881 [Pyrus ussuriensis x Pyrus communis]KAB2623411.1 hypothetical protein D8674_039402 [Pyrus ussuriensis x Pyrus communis]TQD79922.1 hypothetical protein C1H46_034514 [Malus baccata]